MLCIKYQVHGSKTINSTYILYLTGRGVNMIQPTKTLKDSKLKEFRSSDGDVIYSGEGRGAPRGRALSEPQLQPTSVLMTSSATLIPEHSQQGRQASPDIQDIITGIVKLLNGNVNVQANTAPAMGRPLRPISTRINNRGPPRITDVPALPPDFDSGPLPPPPIQMPPPPSSTRMPTPYPFDLPPQNSSPIKPYLNGVPLPEPIVPSGYPGIRRPVNIPPWKRPQRRPPPRRPLPYNPYKPIPPLYPQDGLPSPDDPISFSNNSQDVLTLNFGPDVQLIPITDEPDAQTEIETNETVTEITEIVPSEFPPEKEYKDKEKDIPQIEKKKDKNNQKMDKEKQSKYNIIINTSTEINEKSTSVSSSTVEPTVVSQNKTEESQIIMEGIGEASPVLDTSMLEAVSSTLLENVTPTIKPTESLPPTSSSTIVTTTSTSEPSVKKTSATSSKATGIF